MNQKDFEEKFKEIIQDKVNFASSDLLKHSLEGFIDKMPHETLLVIASSIIEKAHRQAKIDLLTFITNKQKDG